MTFNEHSDKDQDLLREGGEGSARAHSVAVAQDSLRAHSNLLEAVNTVSTMLINADLSDYDDVICETLKILGQVVGIDRTYIWENFERDGKQYCRQIYEWSSDNVESQQGKDFTRSLSYDDIPIGKETVFGGKIMNKLVKDIKGDEKRILAAQDVKSILIIPIFHHGNPWGFIGFDDCHNERTFTKENETVLQSGGSLIVSNILRYRMIHSLVEARENALASARAKSEFLARISHEVRTPMNAIIGMTKLAQKNNDPAAIANYLNTVESSAEQLLDIINNVLDMSNIDTGKMRFVFKEFDFEKMLRKVTDLAQIKLQEKDIMFSIECQEPFTHAVFGDERRISQVLLNLLDNATKFTPVGGAVTLRIALLRSDGAHALLRIVVSDSGCGISREMREKIFYPFEQGDGSFVRQYGGVGLGLTICKNLVELMDGKIYVESDEGCGSNFIVEISVRLGKELEAKSQNNGELASAGGARKKSAFDFSGKTIMLAEDIEVNRKLISLFLEETGVTIDNAENGVQAVEKYKAAPDKYNVILMDIQMPLLDGLGATRQIRASGLSNAKTIPIIAMTANAFKEDEELSLKAGMNKHVVKPIDIQELLKTLQEAMLQNCNVTA